EGRDLAGAWGRLLKLGAHPFMAWAVRSSVTRIARLFLIEEKSGAVGRVMRELQRDGLQVTLDAVGEAILTEAEAQNYVARYEALLAWQHAAGSRPPVSSKLPALTPRFDPRDAHGSEARVLARIAP